jgi:glyoxylase-like metal-dependent hydrolase (beta-lactamase superfamily II)
VTDEIYRYNVGDIEVTVLSDGFREMSSEGLVTNASKDEVVAALKAAGLPSDKLKNTYAPVMLTTGGKRVMFDAGNGEAAFAESKGERGRLQHNLAAAGIDRNAVDIVIITHFHADHVNGLLTADNKPAFPNAEIKVPEVEWAFWMDDDEMSRAPKGRMEGLFKNNRQVFDTLGRKVTTYAWDTEVAPGVTAVGTPGHSIGHTSYQVSSGGKRMFIQSDVSNHFVLFAGHPDWHGWFDQDPAQAAATRRRVYDMLAAEQMPVQAYHYPFPALSRIEKNGSGYRVIPVASA